MGHHRLLVNNGATHQRRIIIAFFTWSLLALVTSNVHSSSSGSSQWSLGDFSDLNMDPNRSGGPSRDIVAPGVTLNDAMAEMKCAMRLLGIMRTMCQLPRPSHPISATLLPLTSTTERGSPSNDNDDMDGGGGGGQAAELLMSSCDAPLQAAVRLCATHPSSYASSYFSGQQRPFYWQFDRFAARGRRMDNVPNEYPPGFFAARGRRSGPELDVQEQQRRERKGDTEDEFPTLYVRGFLGSRG